MDILDTLEPSHINGLYTMEVMTHAGALARRYARRFLPDPQCACSFFEQPDEFIRRAQINGNITATMRSLRLEFASRINSRMAHLDTDGRREWLRPRNHVLKGAPCAIRSN